MTVRIVVAIAAVFTAIMVAPGVASANLVDDVVKGVNDTLHGLLGGGKEDQTAPAPETVKAEPTPNAGTPPNYVPPAHGSQQHGQGTGAVVDLTPTDELPQPYDPAGGNEEVVVGGSRGTFEDGAYSGHVTILALLGNELLSADTSEGETSAGPLGDINATLNDICTASGICLSALAVNSDTTSTGSNNSFSVATAGINLGGTQLLDAQAVSSTGSISQAGGCRTASGTSAVADANVAGLTVNAIDSASESRACNDGSESQTNSSSVLGLAEAGIPLPAPGCENGTPDSVLNLAVAALVCNADDSSATGGTQLLAPFGVREGLTAFVLGSTVKAATAASESRARAPGSGDGDDGNDDRDGDGIPNGQDDCPGKPGPASNNGCPRDDDRGGDDDRDGDGVPNDEDNCPNTPGPPSNDGCPIDTDGDGVIDTEDACPTVPGPPENNGCPFGLDTDGDGIPDSEDACPTVPGPPENDGCPFGASGKGPDNLAFTGADVATLGMVGFAVFGVGLGLMALADRRRRRA
jgi:hypothetical protein